MTPIYLDNAATTPISKEVIEVMTETMHSTFGNPSSTHSTGRKARALVELSRKEIAKILNCSVNEIIFTAGGSEADNLVLTNAVKHLGIKRIITSNIEHHAVLNTILALRETDGITVEFVDLTRTGQVDLINLNKRLQDSTLPTLVSLMFVNNEIGNITNLKEVVDICHNNQALFHSDTVQGIGHYNIDLENIKIDFLAASAHKFHGPKGVGFAFMRKKFGIRPLLIGGEQEHGARAGTENVHSILGMAEALKSAKNNQEKERLQLVNLKKHFFTGLKHIDSGISINGCDIDDESSSACHILNVRFAKDYPMLLFQLDLKGIAASGGSACQSGSNKGSHVLSAILDPEEANKTSVRFSFSRYNTIAEIDQALAIIKSIIA